MTLDSFDLQNAACGIAVLDENMVFLGVNKTLADMLETDAALMVGQPLDSFLSSAYRLLFHMQAMTILHVHGRVNEMVVSFAGAQGQQVPALFSAISRVHNGVKVFECVLIGVNERKRLEDELFNIKKAVEQVPGMVYQYLRRVDGTACFPYASDGVRTIYEILPVQLLHSAEKVMLRIHPDDRGEVLRSIAESADHLSIWHQAYRVNLPKRGLRWLEGHAVPESRVDGSVLWHGYIADVTDRHKQYQDVEHRATHDHLTGLANRAEFDRKLKQMVDSAHGGAVKHALCCIDLDHFKVVNDTAGHAAGDQLLRKVAGLLIGCVRAKDTVARLGGDEFALLLDNCDLEAAQRVGRGVCNKAAALQFRYEGCDFRISASVGLVPIDQHCGSAAAAQTAADAALYRAKAAGRNRVEIGSGALDAP